MAFIRLLRATHIGGEGLRPEVRRRRWRERGPDLGRSAFGYVTDRAMNALGVVVLDAFPEQPSRREGRDSGMPLKRAGRPSDALLWGVAGWPPGWLG